MDFNTISFLIAIIGCFVGVAGWVSKRDSKTENEAEWRGSVNTKLNMILGMKDELEEIKVTMSDHTIRIEHLEAKHKND